MGHSLQGQTAATQSSVIRIVNRLPHIFRHFRAKKFYQPKLIENSPKHSSIVEHRQLTMLFSLTCIFSSGRSNKTFKPKKNIIEGTHQYDLMKYATATLGSGNLRLAVRLPEGEDINEWIAVNIVDFFNQINMLYGELDFF